MKKKGFMIFGIYIAAIMAFQFKKSPWKWAYLATIPFMYRSFQRADASGGYVGLFFSFIRLESCMFYTRNFLDLFIIATTTPPDTFQT